MPTFPVSHSLDFVDTPITPHDFLSTTPPFTGIMPAVEIPVPLGFPGLNLFGKHRLADTVKHRGFSVTQSKHDVGPGQIHICYVQPNTLQIVQTLFSSRKAAFANPTVRAGGKPMASTAIVNGPPTPMLACGQPCQVPSGFEVTSGVLNTVKHGCSWNFYFAQLCILAATILLDVLFNKLWKSPGSKGPQVDKQLLKDAHRWGVSKYVKSHLGPATLAAGKDALIKFAIGSNPLTPRNAVKAALTMAVNSAAEYTQSGRWKVAHSQGLLSVGGGHDPATGKNYITGRAGPAKGAITWGGEP